MTLPAPPAEALARLLPPDVDLAVGWRGVRGEEAAAGWYGVVWSRLGRGDLAWRWWERVEAPALAAWIAAERGRVLRELGLHDRAEQVEAPALSSATDPCDVAMLRTSLAADSVGRAEPDRAATRLAEARTAVAALPDGPRAARQRLRLAWVSVEVAYLTGAAPPSALLPRWATAAPDGVMAGTPDVGHQPSPDPAGGGSGAAAGGPVQPSEAAWGSAFHRGKGLLFGGIVHGDLRLLDAAVAEAPALLTWAIHLARADHGAAGALDAARVAWRTVVPPAHVTGEVAATPTAQRLAGR